MKIAMKEGRIVLTEIEQARMDRLKKTRMLRWNKADCTYSAPVSLDLLNTLATIFRLPDFVEKERRRLDDIRLQIEAQRTTERPEPICYYPVKATLFSHQIRAANMAMLAFGVMTPKKGR